MTTVINWFNPKSENFYVEIKDYLNFDFQLNQQLSKYEITVNSIIFFSTPSNQN